MDDEIRKILRKKILTCRKNISLVDQGKRSGLICTNVSKIQAFEQARLVFIYMHFRSEVQTITIIERLLAGNKDVAIPITFPEISFFDKKSQFWYITT